MRYRYSINFKYVYSITKLLLQILGYFKSPKLQGIIISTSYYKITKFFNTTSLTRLQLLLHHLSGTDTEFGLFWSLHLRLYSAQNISK
jgi:hypothetical protein